MFSGSGVQPGQVELRSSINSSSRAPSMQATSRTDTDADFDPNNM